MTIENPEAIISHLYHGDFQTPLSSGVDDRSPQTQPSLSSSGPGGHFDAAGAGLGAAATISMSPFRPFRG